MSDKSGTGFQPVNEENPAIKGGTRAKSVPYSKERRYGEDELRELKEALEQDTLFYAFGTKVKQLETDFSEKVGAKYAIAASSGTAAIHAALIAAGISPGDEVVTAPITDMGSVAPILFQGAVPVFADVHPTRHVMTVDSVIAVLTKRTRAVIAVHLWGNACDSHGLRKLCDERGIYLIEDCAQAYGCKTGGTPVGIIGHMGCFSLNEFKHIACGDGGMVLTQDVSLAERLHLATDKGYSRVASGADRNPVFLCNNYRMTELHGAVALAQLRKLDSIIARRQSWCSRLSAGLANIDGLQLPEVSPGGEASWWFYMFRINQEKLGANADKFAEALKAEGLPVAAHYIGRCVYEYPIFTEHSAFPRGHHAYQNYKYRQGLCPQAEALLQSACVLSINEAYSDHDLEETLFAFHRCVDWFERR